MLLVCRESMGHRDSGAVANPRNATFTGVYVKLEHQAFTGLVFKPITISEAGIMSLAPISFLKAYKP